MSNTHQLHPVHPNQQPFNPLVSTAPDNYQQYGYYSQAHATDNKPVHINGSSSNYNLSSNQSAAHDQIFTQPSTISSSTNSSNIANQMDAMHLSQASSKNPSFPAYSSSPGMPISTSSLLNTANGPQMFAPPTPNTSSFPPFVEPIHSGRYSQPSIPAPYAPLATSMGDHFHTGFPPMATVPYQTGPPMIPPQMGQQMMTPQEGPIMTKPQPGQPMMPPQTAGQQMGPLHSGQFLMPPHHRQPLMPVQLEQSMGIMPPQAGQPVGMMQPSSGQPMGMMPPSFGQPIGMMPPSSGQPMGMMPPSSGQSMGMLPPQASQTIGTPPIMPPGMATGSLKSPSARVMADNMPSAVEVIANDRKQRSGVVYNTGQTDIVPPLVTTDFVCRDEGNCNPRFLRSSLYQVPISADLMKQIGLPFVVTCQPFANLHSQDERIMLSDMGPQGPVRCVRCKAYISPFFTFIDGGRRFQCCLCGACTDVPTEYFAHLDHTGRRIDAFQRPELCLGSYELVATKEYCKNDEFPLPPAFIFLLDVSQTSIRSGLVNIFCSRFITEILPNLPSEEKDTSSGIKSPVSVGFITYDTNLHFYSLVRPKSSSDSSPVASLSKPQMNVVADTMEVFVPSVEGFLVPADAGLVTNLLSIIPDYFTEGPQTISASPDPILGPAIQAGLEALKDANRCGKLFVLHSCLPTAEAPGKLKHREDRHAVGTDKEKTLLTPATDFYTNLGKQCVDAGCSVDMFLFPNSYVDVATISEVSRVTAGNLYKYSCFQADIQGEQFISDLRTAVNQPKAFNAVMRIRTSTGTRPFEFLGNAHLPNTTDIEMAAIDCHQSVCCEIRHDDNLVENDLVFIQAAILYTSIGGQRRLRIHNTSLSTSSSASDVFRMADLDCFMNWLAKIGLQHAVVKTPAQILTDMTARVSHALAGYRRLCTGEQQGSASPGELVLPETIKLLPLYIQCLIKSDAIRSAKNTSIDDRSYVMFLLNSMGPKDSNKLLYPRIIPLHSIDPAQIDHQLHTAIRCSFERLALEGAYFIENGIYAFIWCGKQIDPVWIQNVFGVTDVHNLEPEKATLAEHNNPLSKCICQLVYGVLKTFTHHPKLRIIRQGELSEAWVKRLMYEDRDDCGNASYVEYLCHIHKEVRSMLR